MRCGKNLISADSIIKRAKVDNIRIHFMSCLYYSCYNAFPKKKSISQHCIDQIYKAFIRIVIFKFSRKYFIVYAFALLLTQFESKLTALLMTAFTKQLAVKNVLYYLFTSKDLLLVHFKIEPLSFLFTNIQFDMGDKIKRKKV